MKKILLYHLFPVNNWKEVTQKLLWNVPHDDIFVHASLDHNYDELESQVRFFFRSYRSVKGVFFSRNSSHPEVDAIELFREYINFSNYSLLTYMHSKGVTKPDNQNIKDWTELMRYFIIEKMATCVRVLNRGYLMYGVNKTLVKTADKNFKGSEFYYAGNFVSVKLTSEMIEKIQTVSLTKEYYGLEGFWGKLCSARLAYNAFHSRINHYSSAFPEYHYKNWLQRLKYTVISFCYHQYYILRSNQNNS